MQKGGPARLLACALCSELCTAWYIGPTFAIRPLRRLRHSAWRSVDSKVRGTIAPKSPDQAAVSAAFRAYHVPRGLQRFQLASKVTAA